MRVQSWVSFAICLCFGDTFRHISIVQHFPTSYSVLESFAKHFVCKMNSYFRAMSTVRIIIIDHIINITRKCSTLFVSPFFSTHFVCILRFVSFLTSIIWVLFLFIAIQWMLVISKHKRTHKHNQVRLVAANSRIQRADNRSNTSKEWPGFIHKCYVDSKANGTNGWVKKNRATINRNINEKVQYLVRWFWWYICNFLPFSLFGFFYFSDSMAMHIFEVTIFYKHWIEHCIFYKSINWIRSFFPLLSFVTWALLTMWSLLNVWSIYGGFVHTLQNNRKNRFVTNIEFVATTDSISHTRCTYKSFKYTYLFFFAWMIRNLSNMYCLCVCVWFFFVQSQFLTQFPL